MVSNQYVTAEKSAISPLIQSLELEWIRSRQNYYFTQMRSLILQTKEMVGVVEYDCRSEVEREYSFDLGWYGTQDEKTGYFELFSVYSPPFSQNQKSSFENDLSIGVCKVLVSLVS